MQSGYSGRHDLRYRPDIDGLRGVAILGVMFGHIGLPHAEGGFVGVDIFFVISGYLIAGNIARSIAAGEFSLGAFYRRRILRIGPALACMLAATSVLVCFVLPPLALIQYGESLLAAIFSFSNLYFATQTSYFDPTFTKMLLHTWSLGVEEQFYLVFPVAILLACRRPPNGARWLVATAAAISFCAASYLTFRDAEQAFYMPYARAWELLLGSALALGPIRAPQQRAAREFATTAAALVIFVCVWFYQPSTPFPGPAAFPPCAAAAMLIAAGERGRTAVGAVLAWRPLAFIGTISYSVYLWHWPVALMVRLGLIPRIHNGTRAGYLLAIALSLVLGALSWRFIERPFLGARARAIPERPVFAWAGASALALSTVALIFIAARGLPGRFSPEAVRAGDYVSTTQNMRTDVCFLDSPRSQFDAATCLSTIRGKRNVLLLGDSHAAALWWGLNEAMRDVHVLQANAASCPVTRGAYDSSQCGRLRRYVYETYLNSHRVDAAILTQRWFSPADLDAWEPALRWFREHRIPVIVVGPVPEYSAPLPLLLSFAITRHEPDLATAYLRRGFVELDSDLGNRLARRPGVRYASVLRAICPRRTCDAYADRSASIPMLYDDNHLTNAASLVVVRRLQRSGELQFPTVR